MGGAALLARLACCRDLRRSRRRHGAHYAGLKQRFAAPSSKRPSPPGVFGASTQPGERGGRSPAVLCGGSLRPPLTLPSTTTSSVSRLPPPSNPTHMYSPHVCGVACGWTGRWTGSSPSRSGSNDGRNLEDYVPHDVSPAGTVCGGRGGARCDAAAWPAARRVAAVAAGAPAAALHARVRLLWGRCACWARPGYQTRRHAAWERLSRPLGAMGEARAPKPPESERLVSFHACI